MPTGSWVGICISAIDLQIYKLEVKCKIKWSRSGFGFNERGRCMRLMNTNAQHDGT